MELTELIKNNHVYFDSLRQGFAYYRLDYEDWNNATHNEWADITKTDEYEPEIITFQFTIPLDDIGNGTLRNKMKAIECMRWIRKAMESGELIKVKRCI